MEQEAPTQRLATPEVTITYRLAHAVRPHRNHTQEVDKVFVHQENKTTYNPLTKPEVITDPQHAQNNLYKKTTDAIIREAITRGATTILIQKAKVLPKQRAIVANQYMTVEGLKQTELEDLILDIQEEIREDKLGITLHRRQT